MHWDFKVSNNNTINKTFIRLSYLKTKNHSVLVVVDAVFIVDTKTMKNITTVWTSLIKLYQYLHTRLRDVLFSTPSVCPSSTRREINHKGFHQFPRNIDKLWKSIDLSILFYIHCRFYVSELLEIFQFCDNNFLNLSMSCLWNVVNC